LAHRVLRRSHRAPQDRAVVDHDRTGFYVTHEFTGAPDVDALAGLQRANHVATKDYFRGLNFRSDPSVWADCESPTGDANSSFELAIQEQITVTGDLSFDPKTLTHSRWRVRSILWPRGLLCRGNRRRQSAEFTVIRFAPHGHQLSKVMLQEWIHENNCNF
jgi:hypothetical protein